MEKKKSKKSSGNSIVEQLRNIRSKVPKSINTSFDSRVSLPAAETRRDKRVRFEEPDSLHASSCEPNSISRNVSRNPSPNCEGPKTSEFAFYKKLREDAAASSSHSYQLHKQHEQLEKSQPKCHAKDLTVMTKPKHVIRCGPPIEKRTPILFMPTVSPKVSVNSGDHSGSENIHKDIFSIKRQKLLHLAVEVLSLDINKQCSTGFDLVSMLLQRLHPEKSAIEETTCSRSRLLSSDTKFNRNSQLLVSVESATPSDELFPPARMSLICPLGMRNFENGKLDNWYYKSREYNLSQDVGKDQNALLTWYPNNKLLEYEARQPDNNLDFGEPSNLLASRDSTFHVQPNEGFLMDRAELLALGECETRQPNSRSDIQLDEEFSSKRGEILALDYIPNLSNLICSTYQNLGYNSGLSEKSFDLGSMSSFKESDNVFCSNTLGTVSKQCNQFLCWGSNTMEEEEQDFFSSTSGTPIQETLQSENRTVGATEMYSPCSKGIPHCSEIALGSIFSRRYLIDIIGRQSPEEREYQVEEPDDFLPLRCTPKYLGPEERCRLRSIMYETSIFSSPPSTHRPSIHFQSSIDYNSDLQITGKDINGGVTELLLDSGITEGERFMGSLLDGETETYFTENLCRFEIPFNDKFCPPFLDEPSRMMTSREMCYDCNGDYGGQLCLMDSPASAFIMD